ncbi:hypothetical protein E2493_14485 [Sphingomonas parva]|uniref:Uncharacterized protein n=1 Tax=Sphingomonas parva TaxID=2555898 RepID=A0A4Y8ZQL9_9SPHN|nr:hypothetical protein [Sphingomonas parva]TFI57572.1 hypothetical protein E2493_14485 [Sphingomonas parva]
MRLDPFPAPHAVLAAALLLLGIPAAAQPAPSLEARLRAIEARLAALEGRQGSPPAAAPAAGPACRKLNLNGSSITPEAALTVTVNGTTVGTFEENAYSDLETFMRPGANTIGIAFRAPGPGASAELRCLPPGSDSSRNTIFSFTPRPNRLSAQTEVTLAPR